MSEARQGVEGMRGAERWKKQKGCEKPEESSALNESSALKNGGKRCQDLKKKKQFKEISGIAQ